MVAVDAPAVAVGAVTVAVGEWTVVGEATAVAGPTVTVAVNVAELVAVTSDVGDGEGVGVDAGAT